MRKNIAFLTLACVLASCATTQSPTVTPEFNLAGNWFGRSTSGNSDVFRLDTTVANGKVTGKFYMGGVRSDKPTQVLGLTGDLSGSVTGDKFSLTVSNLIGDQAVPKECTLNVVGYGENRNDSLIVRVTPNSMCPTPVLYVGLYLPSTGLDGTLHRIANP